MPGNFRLPLTRQFNLVGAVCVVVVAVVSGAVADPLPNHRSPRAANESQPPAAADIGMEQARAEYEMRRAAVHARLRGQSVAPQALDASPHAAETRGRHPVADAGTVATSGPPSSTRHLVPFLPHADTPGREGLVRVVNLEDRGGEVLLEATDDGGRTFGPVALAIGARQTVQLSARDVQQGNAAKGLPVGIGPPEGDWRLALTSVLAIRVLAHARSASGTLASIHERLRKVEGERRTALFRPLDDAGQGSRLRVINPGSEPATVVVRGIDASGGTGGWETSVRVPPGGASTVTAEGVAQAEGAALGWDVRLRSNRPIHAMHLLDGPNGQLANLSARPITPQVEDGLAVHAVPFFPAAAAPARGLLHMVNRSESAGEVRIQAFDDAGRSYGPASLQLAAGAVAHLTSEDLEQGNKEKGLAGAFGRGEGAWRLRLYTSFDLQVSVYSRAEDGFLMAGNATAPNTGETIEVAFFAPADWGGQGGRLRVVNWNDADVEATISGVDEGGTAALGQLRVTIGANTVLTLTAAQLESGGNGFVGAFGDGAGAWRLAVRAAKPLDVMSLLPAQSGDVANLSTFSAPEDTTAAGVFGEHIAPIVQGRCTRCHVAGGVAAHTRLVFEIGAGASVQTRNLLVFERFLAQVEDGANVILRRIQGVGHGGGAQVAADTEEHALMARFLARLGAPAPAAAPTAATLFDGVRMAPHAATLRRAALIFAGRAPTPAERAAVAAGDAQALRNTLRELLTGNAFHQFLLRAANDRLLTDRELGRFSVIGNDGFFVDYDREYIRLREAGGRAVWDWHHAVQYGAARAPLELIAHVVENDRPYTEILTANHIMANPAAARVYGASTVFDDVEDVHEFQPAAITRYHHHGAGYQARFDPGVGLRVLSPGPLATDHPLVGLLNTKAFLQRYPTTATNRNRARARWTYYHFLGVDVEQSASRTTDPVALADRDNPTLRNPACTVCHGVLDPVAGAFQNYGESGYYRDQWGGMDAMDYFYKNGAGSALPIRGESRTQSGPVSWTLLSWTLSLPAGETTLGVTYTNDFHDDRTGLDGAIHLDRLRVLDESGREVARYEFEKATPVAPWGPCGAPGWRNDHLRLWNGGPECAVHVPVSTPAAGAHLVELFAWAQRHARYGDDGFAKVSVVADPYRRGDTWFRDMRAPGFDNEAVPDSARSLRWLAGRIVADDRFAPAAVRFWWPAVMGGEVAEPPARADDADYSGQLLAAAAQHAEVARLAAGFRRGFGDGPAYNLKDLLVELALSRWFRADAAGELDPLRRVALRGAGAKRLLTPEELSRKTAALTGFEWGRWHHPARKPHRQRGAALTDEEGYRLLYGGIDSDGVTRRARQMTSLMAGVAQAHAARASCPVVLREFYLLAHAERRLFSGIGIEVSPHFEAAGDFALDAANKTYSLRGQLTAGAKTAFLKFPNDLADAKGDRNVRLDRFEVLDGNGERVQAIELETLPAQDDCNFPLADHYALHCRGWLKVPFAVDAPGTYAVRVRARGDLYGDQAPQLQVVVEGASPTPTGERAVKRQIARLHERLLGAAPEAAIAEAQTTYRLFLEIWQRKRASGETGFWDAACQWDSDIRFLDGFLPDAIGERSGEYGPYKHWRWPRVDAFWGGKDTSDPHYAARAWVAVLAYLMMDYRYLHL